MIQNSKDAKGYSEKGLFLTPVSELPIVPLPGGNPLSVLTFLWAYLYHPYGTWARRTTTNPAACCVLSNRAGCP